MTSLQNKSEIVFDTEQDSIHPSCETATVLKHIHSFYLMFNIKVRIVFDTAIGIIFNIVQQCGIIAIAITIFLSTNMKTVILCGLELVLPETQNPAVIGMLIVLDVHLPTGPQLQFLTII